ncbi:MAG: aldehyde dehydrogenase family protein, partial [Candidatus Omnitrophica bacterium]|nr:aldehyde dehydrogenase family protein [Candidatus Omnitrophota bacterium]
MIPQYGLFINGEWKQKEEKSAVINPSTGELLAEISCASARDVDEAISAARSAFDTGIWPSLPPKERKKIILSIGQGILDKAGDLARLESLNAGKPIKESTFMDIPSAAKVFEHFGNYFEEYSKEETVFVSPDIKGNLAREPRGVAVLIVPWNYPLLITSWKMAQALSAGNTVVLKPSSLTPLTALELGKIIREAGVPDGVVNIITGKGDTVGEALCGDRRIDMISFTGSNAVGRKIFEYSSSNIKKIILELGGKSASIILDDADIELAVNGSLCSIFLNQGQMCTAMSRIFVSKNIFSAFVSDFTAKARKLKLGNAVDYETQMGPLISSQQLEKVSLYVKQALAEGAQILCGGEIPSDNSLRNGFFFEPTVLTNVS